MIFKVKDKDTYGIKKHWQNPFPKEMLKTNIIRIDLEKMTSVQIPGLFIKPLEDYEYSSSYSSSYSGYGNLIVQNRFCIIFDTECYILYDLIANREVKRFGARSRSESNTLYVMNRLEYVNETFVFHQQNPEIRVDLYVLTDKQIVAKETECVICFGLTNKYLAPVPCGHIRYCESCIEKIKTTKCAVCNTQVQYIMKLYP